MRSIATALVAAAALVCASAGPVVTTTLGQVEGYTNELANVWSKIPYAAPPVGSLRWKPPQAHASWGDVLSTTTDPPGCPQDCGLPPHTCPPVQSEDCLFLNVFAPKNAPAKLPVVAFIHGGNFKQGYSGGILYDCSYMAAKHNVVCVTLNYRLGALGALYTGDKPGQLNGNYGFQDQQFALQWVADNAAAFGGDPNNVNIWGQSAGAASVALHNTVPSSKGLFAKSYMMSEPFALPLRTPGTWGPLAKAYTKFAGCTSGNATAEIDCLMGVEAADLVTAQTDALKDVTDEYPRLLELFMPWTPTMETPLIPQRPVDAFHTGAFPDPTRPMMITTVANEAFLFIYEAFGKPMSKFEYDLVVDAVFLGNGGKVHKQFPLPANQTEDARPWMSHIGTLALFVCPTRYAMQGAKGPAYVGHFDHVMSFGQQVWGPNFQECDTKVCHGEDLPFIFHPNASLLELSYTSGEQNLSLSMQSYWTSLASTGTPLPPTSGLDAGIQWPTFNMTDQRYLRLDAPENSEQEFTFAAECDFFDEIGYNFY